MSNLTSGSGDTDPAESEGAFDGGGREDAREKTQGRGVDPKLLDMLACPLTKAPLRWKPETSELVSGAARLAYPVRDGVPIMLPSEARQLEDGETGL